MKKIEELVRPNILRLAPYSSARNEYSGKEAHVFLDANENPYNQPLNRYPDPLQRELKEVIEKVKSIPAEYTFVGNGSDEAIDLVYRCFTQPGIDNVVAMEPTYGMYKVCADINDVEYRPVLLDENFQITAEKLLSACDDNTKAIWICSPNNPTGNSIVREEIIKVIETFEGLVVVDEAYSDFSQEKPLRLKVGRYTNLIVLNTLSKAWGCAAIRLGIAFANPKIIEVLNKVKYPYNVNLLTQQKAMEALDPYTMEKWLTLILQERGRLMTSIRELPLCEKIYPTDANFFLVKVKDAQKLYDYLVEKGIIVRNRSRIALCENCLRITVGSKSENAELLSALRQY